MSRETMNLYFDHKVACRTTCWEGHRSILHRIVSFDVWREVLFGIRTLFLLAFLVVRQEARFWPGDTNVLATPEFNDKRV